ncbi:radical SAM protein [Candidatus Parcubacteria bacterium]|nr:radical SAM protein [Candidatus Parcubacteria bacterium]
MSKRIEIYLGWRCTNDCIFCVEEENRKSQKTTSLSEVKAYLKNEAENGADHVTFLGGEPSIQEIFPETIKYAKEKGYKICIATNGAAFVSESFSRVFVPQIDEIIVSVHGHNNVLLDQITQRKNSYSNIEKALKNIIMYFNGELLKTNTVIMGLNYKYLLSIVESIFKLGIKEADLSVMDLYGSQNKEKIFKCLGNLPVLAQIKKYLNEVFVYAQNRDLNLLVNDIPLCYLGDFMTKSGNLYYDNRIKISNKGVRLDRAIVPPRSMVKAKECGGCRFYDLCPGFVSAYYRFFPKQKVYPFK